MRYCYILLMMHFTCPTFCQQCQLDPNKRIEEENITPPNNFICHVVVQRRKGWNATVSFVSPNVIVGAGHSFREKSFSKIKGLTIYIGQRNEKGENQWIVKKYYPRSKLNIYIHPEFQRNGNPDYDYSFIGL